MIKPLVSAYLPKNGMVPIVLLLSILFPLTTFAVGFICGTGDYWNTPVGDVADAQIGWFYYARDAWRFPLFLVGNYHLPEGSYVTLSDSLPLAAVLFKCLYKSLY